MKEIINALNEIPNITFDATVKVSTKSGGQYSFKYASLPHILNIVKPILAKHNLALYQSLNQDELSTVLMGANGSQINSTTKLHIPEGITCQEQGAIITYMRRYAIVCLLGIAADEDNDANEAVGNQFQKKSNNLLSFEELKEKFNKSENAFELKARKKKYAKDILACKKDEIEELKKLFDYNLSIMEVEGGS